MQHVGQLAQTAIIPLIFEALFYGVYLVLFILASRVFRHRGSSGIRYIPFATFIMWALSTMRIGFDVWAFYRFCATGRINNRFDIPLAILHTTNDLIANGVMVHRCHILCKSSYATHVSVLLFLVSGVIGYVFPLSAASFGLALGTHVVATALSVLRIAKSLRHLRCLGQAPPSFVSTAIHILLESGLLYSICLLALTLTSGIGSDQREYTVPMTLPNMGPVFASVYTVTSQLVGIAPTLSIVRIYIRIGSRPVSSDDCPTSPIAIRFASRRAPSDIESQSSIQAPEKALNLCGKELIQYPHRTSYCQEMIHSVSSSSTSNTSISYIDIDIPSSNRNSGVSLINPAHTNQCSVDS